MKILLKMNESVHLFDHTDRCVFQVLRGQCVYQYVSAVKRKEEEEDRLYRSIRLKETEV